MKSELIVFKLGSSTVANSDGTLNQELLKRFVSVIAQLKQAGHHCLIVSSGAIAAGRGRLGLKVRPRSMGEKQAIAAIGQTVLMQTYERLFAEQGIIAAQILLTLSDVTDRTRCVNAQTTLKKLIHEYGAIPVINENDTVATEEIRFGDNDRLSALVAAIAGGDRLIICSDVDGLYDSDPHRNPNARHFPHIDHITPEILALGGKSRSGIGTGGMNSKLGAAKIATASGAYVTILDGQRPERILELWGPHEIGTTFQPAPVRLESRKCWIAYGSEVQGELSLDDGAIQALKHARTSLLPVGIRFVQGEFRSGETVSLSDRSGSEIGRGVVRYSSQQLKRWRGLTKAEILSLGEGNPEEAINRDALVIW